MHRNAARTALALTAVAASTLVLPLASASAAPRAAATPSSATASSGGTTDGVVVAKGGLVGHSRPSRHAPDNYTFPNGSEILIDCEASGTVVHGNERWYLAFGEGDANWVSARYVRTVGARPTPCDPSDGSYSARTRTALKKRVGPSAADDSAGAYAKGHGFRVVCFTGFDQKWYLTDTNRWVRAKYVKTSSKVRYCSNI